MDAAVFAIGLTQKVTVEVDKLYNRLMSLDPMSEESEEDSNKTANSMATGNGSSTMAQRSSSVELQPQQQRLAAVNHVKTRKRLFEGQSILQELGLLDASLSSMQRQSPGRRCPLHTTEFSLRVGSSSLDDAAWCPVCLAAGNRPWDVRIKDKDKKKTHQ
jgi:hypothetical protein